MLSYSSKSFSQYLLNNFCIFEPLFSKTINIIKVNGHIITHVYKYVLHVHRAKKKKKYRDFRFRGVISYYCYLHASICLNISLCRKLCFVLKLPRLHRYKNTMFVSPHLLAVFSVMSCKNTLLSPNCPTKIIGSKIDFKVSTVMHPSFSLVSVHNSAFFFSFTVLSVQKVDITDG